MSISRKSGAFAPENHPFVSGTVPHVLLRHDRVGSPDCFKPYHFEPLRRYCARPPGNSAFKLFGIYPSERAAVAAMEADAKDVREQMRRYREKLEVDIQRLIHSPPAQGLTLEERAKLRALGKQTRGGVQ